MTKQDCFQVIDAAASELTALSDDIWGYAELSLQETRSAKRYVDFLQKAGFAVETNIAGIETAFTATYGSGRPIIGILAEYDALSGLSQKANYVKKESLTAGGCGHGCGHNLLGAGALSAALGIKHYLSGGHSGTVILYGCPGEEGCAAKAFMAQQDMFRSLDAALAWHPGDTNEVTSGRNQTSLQVLYRYHGIASHAAESPHMGRSALDAVELLNIGVQFLREHIAQADALHYAILDAGGCSPNVVQPEASVLYMLRSDNVPHAQKLLKRLDNIAHGAALMTETTMDRQFVDGTADIVPNAVLEQVLFRNMQEVGVPTYTTQETDFAAALRDTYPHDRLPGSVWQLDDECAAQVKALSENNTKALNDYLMPYRTSNQQNFGSSDVGDVSHQTPTAQFTAVTWASGSPGHSWQNVAIGKHSIAHKGMLYAGKVLCAAAIDLYESPALLKQAREEWQRKNGVGYICPIEDGTIPTIL
ncbi:MAG: amidohydrolase [Clostridiales bacterium]|nr:amidohydrolase [Candidatus Cacconaster stercorequi]